MSYIGLVAQCAALAVQHDMDKAKVAGFDITKAPLEDLIHGKMRCLEHIDYHKRNPRGLDLPEPAVWRSNLAAIEAEIERRRNIDLAEVDDTQVELAQRWLDGGSPMKPYGMTDAEWEFGRRPEWTPEEIARIRATRLSRVP